jgi:hypothetical protein
MYVIESNQECNNFKIQFLFHFLIHSTQLVSVSINQQNKIYEDIHVCVILCLYSSQEHVAIPLFIVTLLVVLHNLDNIPSSNSNKA